eukprot:TRINITY_DN38416_c0_g1_i2.p2 TRINITY_DN38416_c0_g1~~TRINITY_DN38416_c0_g1_i2.p2  ORF type:complete len:225 (-),score=60.62 TRINITY_DN38416_c0_g1_i2:114-788(-)
MSARLVTRRLTPQYATQAVDLIADSFVSPDAGEPLSMVMGLTKRHWRSMTAPFVERCSDDKLSFVVVDSNTDKVKGVLLNEDWKEVPPKEFRHLDDAWKPAQALFASANNQFKSQQGHIARGQMLHTLYFSCIHPELRRQGMMQQMWQESVEVAQKNNFSELMVHCTSDAAESLAGKLGFQRQNVVKFSEFGYDGQKPFMDLPEMNEDFRELACFKRKVPSDLY